jgi:hypothetical protein
MYPTLSRENLKMLQEGKKQTFQVNNDSFKMEKA